MSQEWYVYQGEQQKGPYAWEELWELARSGALKPEDLVWVEGMDDWAPARQIAGLAGIPASATVPPPPPPIGAEASRPPSSSLAAPSQAGPPKVRTWRLVAAVASAAVLIAGSCSAAYVLFLRDRALPSSSAETSVLPSASTTAAPADLGGMAEGTKEMAAADEEPPQSTPEQPLPESSTQQAEVGGEAQPTAEPTIEPTAEPTPKPTATMEAEVSTLESPTETPETSDGKQPDLPSPAAVVDEFIRVTLGTVPGGAVDYDRARALMTVPYAAEFATPAFVPRAYGIQEGPTSYRIDAEELSGSTATVLVLGYWGTDLGREWRFVLEEEAGLWRVTGIEVLDAAELDAGEEAQSPFWQLNPMVEAFTVYGHGGWKLVVAFDPPTEAIGAEFRIEYRRLDDGSLAYSQESSGVIEAGRARLTLNSDWTNYDLSQLGFGPGEHRVVASIDGVEIASGELIVE